jgi:hypothetical protein
VQLSPNPAKEYVALRFSNTFSGQLTVTDISGRLMQESFEKGVSEKSLDVSGFSPGIYFVVLQPEAGESTYLRFCVAH